MRPKFAGKPRGGKKKKRLRRYRDRKKCRFCRNKTKYIDYKDLDELRGLCTHGGKIAARKRSGNCARCQKAATRAIKYARFLGLLSHVESPPRGPHSGRPY